MIVRKAKIKTFCEAVAERDEALRRRDEANVRCAGLEYKCAVLKSERDHEIRTRHRLERIEDAAREWARTLALMPEHHRLASVEHSVSRYELIKALGMIGQMSTKPKRPTKRPTKRQQEIADRFKRGWTVDEIWIEAATTGRGVWPTSIVEDAIRAVLVWQERER